MGVKTLLHFTMKLKIDNHRDKIEHHMVDSTKLILNYALKG